MHYVGCILFILAIINITLTRAIPMIHQNETQKKCDLSHVWIDHLSSEGCYSKVRLNQKCNFDRQCNSVTPYSFCGWNLNLDFDVEDNIVPICRCIDGFMHTNDKESCIPFQRCSIKTFNSEMDQADCNSADQFCRNGICLCKPNYGFNYVGACVSVAAIQNGQFAIENDNINLRSIESNSELKARLDTLYHSLRHTHFLMLFIMFIYVLTVALFICIHRNKRIQLAEQQSNQQVQKDYLLFSNQKQ